MTESSHEELFKRIKGSNILALPQSASKVLALSKNSENGPPEYAVPISADPGLASQILRFVNSSFFGFRYQVTTIQAALSLISVQTIKNFVLWNAVFAMIPNPRSGPFQLKLIFQDALRRGAFCKVLASQLVGLDPEESFVAGLFQDMSIPVLAQLWPNEYAELLTQRDQFDVRLSTLEDSRFGWNHAIAGAFLVETWGFGAQLAPSIRNHIHPVFDHDGSKSGLADAVVALSSLLPSVRDERWNDSDEFFIAFYKVASPSVLANVVLPPLDQLFAEVDAQYLDLLAIIAIPPSSSSLVNFYKTYSDSLESEE